MLARRNHLSRRERHGFPGCAENVAAVDLIRFDHPDSPSDSRFGKENLPEFFPAAFGELFGIVQSRRDPVVIGKNHRGGDNRSGQTAAAGFINPR